MNSVPWISLSLKSIAFSPTCGPASKKLPPVNCVQVLFRASDSRGAPVSESGGGVGVGVGVDAGAGAGVGMGAGLEGGGGVAQPISPRARTRSMETYNFFIVYSFVSSRFAPEILRIAI